MKINPVFKNSGYHTFGISSGKMKEMGKVERRMNSPNLFQVTVVLIKELKDSLPAEERT